MDNTNKVKSINKEWPTKRAMILLDYFNKIVAGTPDLRKIFTQGGYDLLQSYQGLIFTEIETFSKTKSFRGFSPSFLKSFKNIIAVSFLMVVSIASYFLIIVFGKKVMVYSVDRISSDKEKIDERLSAVYEPLFKNNISFIEIFHAATDGKAIRNFFKRGRPAIYLEAVEAVVSIINLLTSHSYTKISENQVNFSGDISKHEREFLLYLTNKYGREASRFPFKEKFFSNLLRWTKIRVFFTIDDLRYYHLPIMSCKKRKIPSFAIQHGHFTKYHVGWLKMSTLVGKKISPDIFFVSSDYWRKELLRLGTYLNEESIIVGGHSKKIPSGPKRERTNNQLGVLMPREARCPFGEVRKYVEAFLDCPNTQVFFKLRRGISEEKQLKDYNFKKDSLARIKVITDIESAIDQINLVVGTYSTLLYDMVAFEKPVAILDTSSDYGEGMILDNMADGLSLNYGVCADLRKIAETPSSVLKERKQRLFGDNNKLMSGAVEEILKQQNLI